MPLSLFLLAIGPEIAAPPAAPELALENALRAVEPPPALRASFKATLTSRAARRTIEYDPEAAPAERFRITAREGADAELDAIVDGWRKERQADVRLFSDALRRSLGDARVTDKDGQLAVSFRHNITPNDGPVDKLISSVMIGRLDLDRDGHISKAHYAIEKPLKLQGQGTLSVYDQTYSFGYSWRWGVSYVTGFQLFARGGRWGFTDTRELDVTVTDIQFVLAPNAHQELASRQPPASLASASRSSASR